MKIVLVLRRLYGCYYDVRLLGIGVEEGVMVVSVEVRSGW